MDLNKLRRDLDDAITYADLTAARRLACEGLAVAQYQEKLGEIMYFKAQQEIIDENFASARRYLDLAVRYNPADGAAYNDRALCLIELGGTESEALADFNKGIEVEPDYATVYHNKGWFLNKLGRHEEAIEYFNRTLELEPRRAVTYENLADAHLHLGEASQAVQAFKKALELLDPSYTAISEQIEAKIRSFIQ